MSGKILVHGGNLTYLSDQRVNAGHDQTCMGLQIIRGRVRHFHTTSPRTIHRF